MGGRRSDSGRHLPERRRRNAALAMVCMTVGLVMTALPTSAQESCISPHWYVYVCVADTNPLAIVDDIERALQETTAFVDFTAETFLESNGQAYVINPLTDMWRMADEPDVRSSGSIPSGASYPADGNNIQDALAGEVRQVLNVKYGMACRPIAVWCSFELAHELLTRNLIVPGEAAFVALYGRWLDTNADGYVQEYGVQDCEPEPHVQVTLRPEGGLCHADEWVPVTHLPRLVGFVEPGQWSRDGLPRYDAGEPDLFFYEVGHGVFVAPAQLLPSRVTPEGSTTTTVVVEAFEGQLAVGGARQYLPRRNTPTDTDLFQSLDPTAETLYGSFGRSAGQLVGETASEALDTLPPSTHPDNLHRWTGPAAEVLYGRYEREQTGRDHESGWHPYLDVRLTETVYARGLFVGAEQPVPAGAPLTGGPESSPGQFVVNGHLGVWRDLNHDGWIGDPRPSDGCADPYDCGNTPDPNEYARSVEFAPYCPTAPLYATVAPMTPTQRWPLGAYVWRDLGDSVLELLDGQVDQLVTGPVALELACDPSRGTLRSLDRIVLPTGDLQGGIRVAAWLEVEFVQYGIEVAEFVVDEDEHPLRSP